MASMASLAFQLPNLPTSRYDLMTWWPVSMTCLKHSQDFSRHHVELLARSAWPCRAAHIVAVLQVQKDSERLWHSMAFYGILTGWRTHKKVGNGWDCSTAQVKGVQPPASCGNLGPLGHRTVWHTWTQCPPNAHLMPLDATSTQCYLMHLNATYMSAFFQRFV